MTFGKLKLGIWKCWECFWFVDKIMSLKALSELCSLRVSWAKKYLQMFEFLTIILIGHKDSLESSSRIDHDICSSKDSWEVTDTKRCVSKGVNSYLREAKQPDVCYSFHKILYHILYHEVRDYIFVFDKQLAIFNLTLNRYLNEILTSKSFCSWHVTSKFV